MVVTLRPANAGVKLPPQVYSEQEVLRMIMACSPRAVTGVRDRGLITVYYRCGLRAAEGVDLMPHDVDLDERVVTVQHGKGDKQRRVGLDRGAARFVEKWVVKRAALGLPEDAPLFCTSHGTRMAESYMRAKVKQLGRRVGISKRVHVHGLRHSFAYGLLREGKALDVIQTALGHEDLATTATYLRHLFPEEAIAAVRDREWAAA